MPRPPRIHFTGAIYHCMARGVEGRVVYNDDEDRRTFLRFLKIAERRFKARVLAYCLMNNHFHLAVQVGEIPLSRMMHWLLSLFVASFNERHERIGHLFQSRYKASLCLDDGYLLALIRYIYDNPVRAGLVKDPTEWKWSSKPNPAAANNVVPADFEPWKTSFEMPTMARGGSDGIVELEAIARGSGVLGADLKSRSHCRATTRARQIFCRTATLEGHTCSGIARWLGVSEGSVRYYLR
jgi:REP element-mobilizing transposase RayT